MIEQIGSYRVLEKLGEGGMGEVYRARDTRLHRDVALKVLPEAFASDPDRLARFEREAQVLASLNHPHIAAIYGLEDAGDIRALVLELVPGDTLEERIAVRGSLSIDEALTLARQIAQALETAHEHGVIHRDLKPSNIKIREDGTLKVLDFGLAKLQGADGGTADRSAQSPLTASPTLISPAMTQAGVIMGTAAYMSPEQARGQQADKRSDLWAFGCVLFEMLTGKPPFAGDTVSDLVASVLRSEPDWSRLPSQLSPSIVTLVKRCLDKDRSRRIADASVATFVLNEPSPPAPEQRAAAVTQDRTARRARFAVAVVVACAAAAGAIVAGLSVWLSKPAPEAPLVTRLTITPPSPNPFRTTIGSNLHAAVSPDGRSVVYPDGRGALLVRPFDSLEARRLPGLGDPIDPFFSPDGQWIGFFNLTSALQKVAITGGPSAALVNLGGAAVRGGTWSEDNRIVFATAAATGLQLVSAEGGTPTSLTTPDRSKGEGDHHVLPQFLPRGRGVLFTILPVSGGLDRAQVAVLDLTSRTYKVILQGASHARYVATGHLIYASGGTLRAVPFDLDTLQVATTPPIPVLSQTAGAGGGAAYDVSPNGTLVYVTGQGAANTYYLFWVDRQGREEPLSVPPRSYLYPRLSPDGSRVALDIRDQDNDVWMWDLTRETLTRVTVDPGLDRFPVWTADGRRLIFSTDRNGRREQLFIQNATDVGAPQPLLESSNQDLAMSVTKDGRVVVRRDFDLMLLTPNAGGGNPSIQPLVQTQFQEVTGALRPAVPRRHWRPLAGVTGWRGAAGVVSRRPRTLLHR